MRIYYITLEKKTSYRSVGNAEMTLNEVIQLCKPIEKSKEKSKKTEKNKMFVEKVNSQFKKTETKQLFLN